VKHSATTVLKQLERNGLDKALLAKFYQDRFPNHLGRIRNEDLTHFYEFINPRGYARAVSELDDEGEDDASGNGLAGVAFLERSS
jgi:hypothetical protein